MKGTCVPFTLRNGGAPTGAQTPRRFTNGTADVNDTVVGLTTDRGYTEHEMLDELGIIHMNGRVYDPYIGRFMSADPFIQAPYELQSHNRYAYVMNNPLLYTDPSGYFSFRSMFRAFVHIFAPAIALLPQRISSMIIGAASVFCGPGAPICNGLGQAALAYYHGASAGDAVRVGVRAGVEAYLFQLAGQVPGDTSAGRYLAHAAVGCVSSLSSGGGAEGCARSAAAAVVGKYVTNHSNFGLVGNGIAAMVSGGVTSQMIGGTFANGAQTAAYGYLFNCVASKCYELKPSSDSRISLYGTPEGSHFGRQATIDTLIQIDEIWRAGGNGQSIEVGNISTENRGHPDHISHQDGEDIDIRPIRTGQGRQGGGVGRLEFTSATYDRDGTQRLVNIILFVAPASTIYFNDPKVQGVKYYNGHNNHLHVRFKW